MLLWYGWRMMGPIDSITAWYQSLIEVDAQSPDEKARAVKLASPDSIEQRLNRRYGPFTDITGLQPLNPFLHRDMIAMAQEVATALNVATPRLYQMFDSSKTGVSVAGCRYPNIVVLDMDILEQLAPVECQAVLYHELHHTRQPIGRILRNQSIGETLLKHPWLQGPGRWWLEQCIDYRQSIEHEASQVAAQFTSPAVMQRAFLKSLVLVLNREEPNLSIDLNQPASQIAASLDAYLAMGPGARLASGGTISAHTAFLDSLRTEARAAQERGRY